LGLFENKDHAAFAQVRDIFQELENFLNHNRSTNYDFVYDQVVIYGELLSTNIVSTYFSSCGIKNDLLDARNCIRTDSTYRDAQVQWDETQAQIKLKVNPKSLTITQGFIGGDPNNFSTTLGREGSDYTAGIFAYCLNVDSVTIWKDVPGVLNADPRAFENPHLLEQISYEEAIELAFYGASVIHPKTLQPLQKKEIPLYVKSFLNPVNPGTAVRKGQAILPKIPCFIVKKDQVLISLSSLDFSFILEKNISEIFSLFDKYQIKVDLIQNSAISFSVCIDNKFNNLEKLINHLKATFRVSYNTGVSLYTIRHFDNEAVQNLERDKKILLKQTTRETVQIVTTP
jgi:aspartate kinase